MGRYIRLTTLLCMILMTGMFFIGPNQTLAASASEINRDVDAALKTLFPESPTARALSEKAKAILVFPAITKVGFIVGGQ